MGSLLLQHQVDDAAGEVAALQVAVDVHAARGAGAVSTICDVGCDVRIHIYDIYIYFYMNKNELPQILQNYYLTGTDG